MFGTSFSDISANKFFNVSGWPVLLVCGIDADCLCHTGCMVADACRVAPMVVFARGRRHAVALARVKPCLDGEWKSQAACRMEGRPLDGARSQAALHAEAGGPCCALRCASFRVSMPCRVSLHVYSLCDRLAQRPHAAPGRFCISACMYNLVQSRKSARFYCF
jgi:hypothetical protein